MSGGAGRIVLMPDTGRTIGPYQLQGQLGAGGMGEVYRALDTRMGRHVALKILPESLARDEERRRRFEQEARLAAALNHPNVMAIYDVGLDQQPPYIVAELVPGESLRALIEKGPMAVRKAVDIAAQIAAGLAAAHAAGIVHRDLKPENAIVTPEGLVKVLDFGVARMRRQPAAGNQTVTMSQTAAGSVVGTAAYMSPEQARAEEDVDHRSDQFSLALVLYETLSGRQAFARPSAVQTMSAIVEDEPLPLERPIPGQLRAILERCLAKEPAGRYESTRDLARELAYLRDHFAESNASSAGLTPAVAAKWRGRRLALPAACALGGALIAWCAAALVRDPTPVDLAGYRITPFATALTIQSYPAWSPDGKSIAFLGWEIPRRWQLFVQAVDAPTAVQVTAPEMRVNVGSPPFWSPDSRAVYFRCSVGAGGGLCRVPAGGGAAVLVQPNVQAAAISPDGGTLAMWPASQDEQGAGVWIASPPEAPRRRYQPMPFQATQFYNNPALAFSPDGRQILLFVALDTRGETAWLLPWPAAKGRAAFTAGFPFTNTPQFSWMPDGRRLVFADGLPGRIPSLYMGDAQSGRHWTVLAEDHSISLPTVSPDGKRVAYTAPLSQVDIVSVPLGDGPVLTLLGSSRDEERVDASRVSQQLVYVTNRRGVPEVWLKSLVEGWERPLVTPDGVASEGEPAVSFLNPVFSPDGRRVAVGVRSRSGTHIYTVFVSGGTPVRATSSKDQEFCATWSPDGEWLAYSALAGAAPSLFKVRPGGGEAPVAIARTYGTAAPVWSPTGEWIADHDREEHPVLVSPDGKSQRVLPGDRGPMTWSHDGRTLYQVRMEPPALFAIEIATGQERKLRDLPDLAPYSNGSPGLSAALTSDGKSMVYAVQRARSEIWILDGMREPRPWYRP
jgi:Tol biopolymer transport system component/predicted Ser/Thr protein kinase